MDERGLGRECGLLAPRRGRAVALVVCFAGAGSLGACGDGGSAGVGGTPPTVPVLVVGEALVSGRVVGADGSVIPGATVLVAETDARVTADAGGAYQMKVPSDSTITLMASAAGLAPTFRESVTIASGSMIASFDLLLLAPEQIAAAGALGDAPEQGSARGLMAVRVHGLDPACGLPGARLTVWPPLAAKVVYSRPAEAPAAMDPPDPTMSGVQAGTTISAWLVGAVPPSNGLVLDVEQAGCKVVSPPSLDGLTFPGQRHVAAQSLTEADLFVGGAS